MATVMTDLALRLRAQTSELKTGLKEAGSSVNKFNNTSKKVTGNVNKSFSGMSKGVGGALQQMTGGLSALGPAASSATGGLKAMAGGAATLNIALGPIGIIIAVIALALKALMSYFKGSVDGAQNFAKIMGVIKGLLSVLQDAFIALGRMIYKAFENPKESIAALWEAIKINLWNRWDGLVKFFSQSFEFLKNGFAALGNAIAGIFDKDKKAEAQKYWDAAKKNLLEMGDATIMIYTGLDKAQRSKIGERLKNALGEINDRVKESVSIEQALVALQLRKIAYTKTRADLETELSKQRLIADDRSNYSDEERLKAADEAIKIQKQLGAEKLAIAKEEYNLQLRSNANSESSIEDLEKAANLYAAMQATVKLTNDRLREVVNKKREIGKQIDANIERERKEQEVIEANKQKAIKSAQERAAAIIAENNNVLAQSDPTLYAKLMDESYDKELEGLKELNASKLLDDQAYFEARSALDQLYARDAADYAAEINRQRNERLIEGAQTTAEALSSITDTLSNLYSASKNRELAAAGDNEKKKEEIEKKYARKQQKLSIAQAIINGALAFTKALSSPLPFIMAPLVAASTAAQIALISSQSFAEGGIVYGPTMGLVGEYPGARSNPEIIAPLDKLQNILGNQGGQVKFVIEGDRLVGILNKNRQLSTTF